MTTRVTSVFLYVKDVRKSLEFYNEVVNAEIVKIHAEEEDVAPAAVREIHAHGRALAQ